MSTCAKRFYKHKGLQKFYNSFTKTLFCKPLQKSCVTCVHLRLVACFSAQNNGSEWTQVFGKGVSEVLHTCVHLHLVACFCGQNNGSVWTLFFEKVCPRCANLCPPVHNFIAFTSRVVF